MKTKRAVDFAEIVKQEAKIGVVARDLSLREQQAADASRHDKEFLTEFELSRSRALESIKGSSEARVQFAVQSLTSELDRVKGTNK